VAKRIREAGFDWAALDRHLVELRGCRKCPRVEPPPVAYRPEVRPAMMLVGQAPGPREQGLGRPFAFTAGARMFAWFARLGPDEQEFRRRVYIAATIRCFPGRAPQGGDRVPAADELANCVPYLETELRLIRPATVIAVGQLAIARFLPAAAPLHERVGQLFPVSRGDLTFEVVPLPHPSGRSTWTNQPANSRLLDHALALLAATRGWQQTFGRAQ
jgi:uracil-DNA glycosylase